MTKAARPRKDWLSTARQTIPRLRNLLGQMRPTFSLADVREINLSFLSRHRITGLIWDVDGTLMTYHAMQIADELRSHMDDIFAAPDLKHVILSNCDEIRFEELKEVFPGLPLVRGYRGSKGMKFRTARGKSDTHSRADVDHLLADGFEQIRKPSGDLIGHALDILKVPAGHTVMVGDQYLTDVASANLGGVRSVKVDTYGRETFPRSIRFSQRLERLLFRIINGRS